MREKPVTLVGHGNDTDGNITGYRWVSNIDGLLSTSPRFSTTNLSVGRHMVSFEVQDNVGVWSVKSEQLIEVDAAISLNLVAAVAGSIGVATGMFLFRDKLGRLLSNPRDDPEKTLTQKTMKERKKTREKERSKRKRFHRTKDKPTPKNTGVKTIRSPNQHKEYRKIHPKGHLDLSYSHTRDLNTQ